MKITFLLPDYTLTPIGGFRIVYGYANALADRGHKITIVFPDLSGRGRLNWILRVRILRLFMNEWFELRPSITKVLAKQIRVRAIPDADAIVATGVQTASVVAGFPLAKGRKYYMIQGFEDWIKSSQEVRETYKLPMIKLAISQWLYREVSKTEGAFNIEYLPNPIDLTTFRIISAPELRNPNHVGMMWSPGSVKRAGDGILALSKARTTLPDLQATFFGTSARPRELPAWINYVRNVHGEKLVSLYNSFSVFLHTSSSEGFPLPPAEAIACGCAVVAARNQGVLEYLDDENSILCDVADVDALAGAVVNLCSDNSRRASLVRAGSEAVGRLDMRRAVTRLEAILSGEFPS